MTGLALRRGTWVRLDGTAHEIRDVDLEEQTVTLAGPGGTPETVPLGWLLDHPGLGDLQPPAPTTGLDDVLAFAPRRAVAKAQLRLEHVREVETGYKSGRPDDGSVPDPRYDPALVPGVVQRRLTKADELAQPAVDRDQRMAYRTLQREAHAWRASKPGELVDGRSCRRPTGSKLAAEVLDAIEDVVEQRRHESNFQTLEGLAFLVRARVMKNFPDTHERLLPQTKYGNKSIIRAAQQMFTDGELLNGKAKYRPTKPVDPGKPAGRLLCSRPGQVLMGDTKDLDVMLVNTIFHGSVRGKLVWFMDVYSHSVPELRVVETSEKAVDIGQLIVSIGRPKLMEPGWGPHLRWPFVGIPEAIVDEVAGGTAAAVPFMQPENLVIDNGRTYRAFSNVAVAKTLGIDVVPAKRLRATDKAQVERSFRTLDTMLCQHLQGYRGPDPSERGTDPEGRARYTTAQFEAIVRHWIADVWQRTILDEDCRPEWSPVALTPNQLYNFGIQQTGLRLRVLSAQEYQDTLPGTVVKLHPRGFKVHKQWFDVEPERDENGALKPDPLRKWRRPGRRDNPDWSRKHLVKFDARDMRRVWWKDPDTGTYVPLRWRGAFGHDDVPSFNDKDAEALAEILAERGLDPLDSTALVPTLIDLLRFHDPEWDVANPTKRERDAASRRDQQERSAERDRLAGTPGDASPAQAQEVAAAVPKTAREQHEQVLEQSRRIARESAGVVGGTAPAPLRGGRRGGGLFDDDAPDVVDGADAQVLPIRTKEQ